MYLYSRNRFIVLFGVKDEMSLVRALFTNWFKTSIKKELSRNKFLSVACVNPRSRPPPCLQNSTRKYPKMPSEFQFKEPPLPSEFREAVRGMVRIFSGIAH